MRPPRQLQHAPPTTLSPIILARAHVRKTVYWNIIVPRDQQLQLKAAHLPVSIPRTVYHLASQPVTIRAAPHYTQLEVRLSLGHSLLLSIILTETVSSLCVVLDPPPPTSHQRTFQPFLIPPQSTLHSPVLRQRPRIALYLLTIALVWASSQTAAQR